ncbi:hypothetical protein CDL12_30060 [Handroanthus impetiginosus]|uniref:Uncharacterized protein n=1 Tax=Handroanthus impetiginosus TaxID=429701 RepID=A0A2G9FWN3_9LAMI|nr:hypothetical protein CDL12_30060 [Handroanthus impetiginosus]
MAKHNAKQLPCIVVRNSRKSRTNKSKRKEVRTKEKENKVEVSLERLQKQNLEIQFQKFLEVFNKLHINIPFVETLEQMLSYVKFMKVILSRKRHLGDYEVVTLTKECSAIIQNKVFYDIGDDINLMPYSIYHTLGLGEAKPTSVTLQLADRSLIYLKPFLPTAYKEDEKDLEVVKTLDLSKNLKSKGVEPLEMPAQSKLLKLSIEEPSMLELKPFPNHLQYTYLGKFDTLPKIISSLFLICK